MLISERDYENAIITKTEERAEKCKEILNNWSRLHDMISGEGWRILSEIVQKEFAVHDSISNAKAEELEFKCGYCGGLKFPLRIVRAYKRKAVEAQKYLDSIAKQENQNG